MYFLAKLDPFFFMRTYFHGGSSSKNTRLECANEPFLTTYSRKTAAFGAFMQDIVPKHRVPQGNQTPVIATATAPTVRLIMVTATDDGTMGITTSTVANLAVTKDYEYDKG